MTSNKKIIEDLNQIQKNSERLLKLFSVDEFKVNKDLENKIKNISTKISELTNIELDKELQRQKASGKKFISDEEIDNIVEVVKSDIELAERIEDFVEKYAAISPNYKDEDDDKYTGPDPYQLLGCAIALRVGKKPSRCHSSWFSGCYKPYSSLKGREEHDKLVKEIYEKIDNCSLKN